MTYEEMEKIVALLGNGTYVWSFDFGDDLVVPRAVDELFVLEGMVLIVVEAQKHDFEHLVALVRTCRFLHLLLLLGFKCSINMKLEYDDSTVIL